MYLQTSVILPIGDQQDLSVITIDRAAECIWMEFYMNWLLCAWEDTRGVICIFGATVKVMTVIAFASFF